MAHPFDPHTGEAEAGEYLCLSGQPDLHREFKTSQGCVVRPCFKSKQAKTKQKTNYAEYQDVVDNI